VAATVAKLERHRRQRNLQRAGSKRPPYQRVLIVSEGSKTEPNYLDEMRIERRLPAAHIRIVPSALGTQPRQVVDYAEQLFRQSGEYDVVVAVFDRDDHATYHDALARAEQLNGAMRNDFRELVPFFVAASVPSFELWLLLHFEDVQAWRPRGEVYARLRAAMPEYEKGTKGVYARTKANLPLAIARAKRLAARATLRDDQEPNSTIFQLIELLLDDKAEGKT